MRETGGDKVGKGCAKKENGNMQGRDLRMKKCVVTGLVLGLVLMMGACGEKNEAPEKDMQTQESSTQESQVKKAEIDDGTPWMHMEQVTEGDIRIADFCGTPQLRACVSLFNGEQEYKLVYNTAESFMQKDTEIYWNKVMAEMVSGDVPDLFCVWAGDEYMETLYDKGILAEMDAYVPEEVKQYIFPGVIESGTVDQTWVGLGISGIPTVLIVSDEIWPKEHWTIEDVLQIEKEHPEFEGLFLDNGKETQSFNAYCMFGDPAFFIDRQNKTTTFQGETFQEALTVLKKYKGTMNVFEKHIGTCLREGRCLADRGTIFHPSNFVDTMVDCKKNGCHLVGDVGQTEGVGHWGSLWLLLVNKNTKNPEAVKQFIDYMLSKKAQNQEYRQLSTREDVIDPYLFPYSREMDGEELWEAYLSFLKNLGACKEHENPVTNIVLEEVEGYLGNDKSTKDMADVVDSRVRLYLLEND